MDVARVPVLAGAFMLVRKNILDKIGGYDERFFMYGEDIDLSLRIEMAGFPNYYLGNVPIIHFKGESTTGSYKYYVRIFYKAMILFVRKYYTGFKGFFSRTILNIGILIRAWIGLINHSLRPPQSIQDYPLPQIVTLIGDGNVFGETEIILRKNIPTVAIFQNTQVENADAIVFCLGKNFEYLDAITMFKKLPAKKAFFWHSQNASSIIGGTNFSTSSVVWS